MDRPVVSIVMPVFNAERYLAEALDSVLAQTLSDFELVVVDDGSTDSSPTLLGGYAGRDARVRVIRQPNAGGTRAMQRGVDAARGRYLARFDADDRMMPDRLTVQARYLDAHADVVAAGSWVRLIDAKGRFLTVSQPPTDNATIQSHLVRGHTAMYHPSVMIRAEVMQRVGGYDMHFGLAQDLDLFLRLGEVGPLANIKQALLEYRLHAGSVSEQKTERQRGFVKDAVERAWQRRGVQDGVLEHVSNWRPGKDRHSRSSFACKYGWWAFNSGERATAVSYGLDAVRATPLRAEPWKLLVASLVKTPVPSGRYDDGQVESVVT